MHILSRQEFERFWTLNMRIMQENQVDKGRLQVVVQSSIGSRPIDRAEISVS